VVGPYKNEYVWFLRFDEEGKKITEIVEFLDSKAAAEILSKVQEVRRA
jgi:ketosteroid isomerase-like protein